AEQPIRSSLRVTGDTVTVAVSVQLAPLATMGTCELPEQLHCWTVPAPMLQVNSAPYWLSLARVTVHAALSPSPLTTPASAGRATRANMAAVTPATAAKPRNLLVCM